ncbi:hypothetical protein N7461_003698 [Penicillium sp. DV-2018c]|nr:hypothetical protein N7461_003698 [Penicillium sp. DV-2018c]
MDVRFPTGIAQKISLNSMARQVRYGHNPAAHGGYGELGCTNLSERLHRHEKSRGAGDEFGPGEDAGTWVRPNGRGWLGFKGPFAGSRNRQSEAGPFLVLLAYG